MRIPALLLFLCACTGKDQTDTSADDTAFVDADGDGFPADVDCDDATATTYPGALERWYDGVDQDCDGSDDDQDGDGYALAYDCDDADAGSYPGAGEVPNDGVDQDCDGVDTTTVDGDNDGYASSVDCDDGDAATHPGADEVWYDGADQDCDGNDDDQDGDGYILAADCDDTDPSVHPDAGVVLDDDVDQDCDGELETTGDVTTDDADGDGYKAYVDCDDDDDTVNPGRAETWYDGIDQDCDGNDDDQDGDGVSVDLDCDDTDARATPGAAEVWYDGVDEACDGGDDDDQDMDGYALGVDCDDTDETLSPGATEIWYDGTDQDCDGQDDDQDGDGALYALDCDDMDADRVPGATEVWYDGTDQDCDGNDNDQDGDGSVYGTDCDDTDPSAHPGATEIWYDGVDEACDGGDDDDQDGDTYALEDDCDDTDKTVHPGATEVWYDGIDQDCDGEDDDQDGDGYLKAEECDDTDPDVYPDAAEVTGDGVDQDCDGLDLYSVSSLASGDLVISEIMNKPSAVDDAYGEYIEVYNKSSKQVDLYGLVVTRSSDSLSFTVDEHIVLASKTYAVLGRDSDTDINGGVDVDFDYRSDFSLDNDAETVKLSYSTTTLDSVAYDDTNYYPDTTGAAMSLDSGHLSSSSNDKGQYWCDAASSLSGGDLGTPGSANSACSGMTDSDGDGWVSAWDCNDGSTKVYPGATETAFNGTDEDCDGADGYAKDLTSGKIFITEIMKNPDLVDDTDGEWFEVYNNTGYAVNLYGLGVGDATGTLFTVDDDLIVSASDYVVFAANSDDTKNGGVTTVDWDYKQADLPLSNGDGAIYLYNGTTKIDSVVYDNGVAFPDPTGASLSLKNTRLSATYNDTGSNWCTSTSSIGGVTGNDLGTPGAKSDC